MIIHLLQSYFVDEKQSFQCVLHVVHSVNALHQLTIDESDPQDGLLHMEHSNDVT